MTFKPLPNNTLILNGHKIYNKKDLLLYITKRLFLNIPMIEISQIEEYKKIYQIKKIKIRHKETFLKDESEYNRKQLIIYLS